MKKMMLIAVAALSIASTAQATNDSDAVATWRFKCPRIGGVEFRKYAVHELGFTVKGTPVEIKRLLGMITNDGDVEVTFKGKRCREVL